jgi:hypothetical protein
MLHQVRDGASFAELAACLLQNQSGAKYGGLILNRPGQEVALAEFTSMDTLVLTTRPALDDDEEEGARTPRAPLRRTSTNLEERVFATLRLYFPHCDRRNVEISPNLSRYLHENDKDRACIEFRMHNRSVKDSFESGATYHKLKRHLAPDDLEPVWHACPNNFALRTATYFVYTPPIWKGGPRVLASFGLGGTETLIWNYLVRTKYAYLTGAPRFFLGELDEGGLTTDTSKLDFATDLKVRTLIDVPLPLRVS